MHAAARGASSSWRRPACVLYRLAGLVAAFLLVIAGGGVAVANADDSGASPTPEPTTIGDCLESGRVWLYVVYDETVLSNQCVGNPSSGVEALTQGGLTIRKSRGGYICALDDVPRDCPSSSYWTYFHALPETGWSQYEYSEFGADSFTPSAGSIEAWCYSHDSTSSDVHCDPQPLRIARSDGTVLNPDGASPAVTTRPPATPASSTPVATICVAAGLLALAVVGVLWTRRRNRDRDQQF